jgi:hypothetical protein
MGGEVKVESDGVGHGTTFVIKMQAISKICPGSQLFVS